MTSINHSFWKSERLAMTFLIAAWYSSFCVAMIFAWKADHLSSLHPQYSRYKIPLACRWKYWKNQMVSGVHLAASRQSRAATFQRGCDVINRWIIGIRNFAKCCPSPLIFRSAKLCKWTDPYHVPRRMKARLQQTTTWRPSGFQTLMCSSSLLSVWYA